jgi:hypothetical protein
MHPADVPLEDGPLGDHAVTAHRVMVDGDDVLVELSQQLARDLDYADAVGAVGAGDER